MEENKFGSFWKRPEGWIGRILTFGLVGGIGYGLWLLLPILITLMTNIFIAIAMGVGLFALVYVLLNKETWNAAGLAYTLIMRAVVGLMIDLDPVGMLNSYVDYLEKRLISIKEKMGVVSGSIRNLREKIAKKAQEVAHAYDLARQAKKQEDALSVLKQGRKAERRKTTITNYELLLKKLELIYRMLDRMKQAAEFYRDDIKDEVEEATDKRTAINAAFSAMRDAWALIVGDDKKAVYKRTIDRMAEDYGMKLGQMENFMVVAEDFLKTMDLENGVMEENALKALETWEKQTDTMLFGGDKAKILAAVDDESNVLDLDAGHGQTDTKRPVSDYAKYYKIQ